MNDNRPHSPEDIEAPDETEMKNIYNKVKGKKSHKLEDDNNNVF